jgi:hypothetical protein
MEKNKTILLCILSLAGVLFAGYLTFRKYVLGVCSFNESCPYFMGHPACIYGLIMYLLMLILSLGILFNVYAPKNLLKGILSISIIGIIFSGYFTVQELFFAACLPNCSYALILPTCAYGLIMYIAISVVSFVSLKKC